MTILLWLLMWLTSPQAQPQQQGTEKISGTVTRSDTALPVPHARLELVREDYARRPTGYEKVCKPEPETEVTGRKRFVMSDSAGKFTFDNIIPGRYYLIAEHEGFLATEYGQRGRFPIGTVLTIGPQPEVVMTVSASDFPRETAVIDPVVNPPATTIVPPQGGLGSRQQGLNAGASSAIRDGTIEQSGLRGGLGRDASRLTAGAEAAISDGAATGTPRNLLQDLAISMAPAPAITGTVVGTNGQPLAAATVQAYHFRYTPLNGRTLKSAGATLTNDEGGYRLFWLNPGRYVIAAGYSNYGLLPWTAGLTFTPNLPNADSGYPISFYTSAATAGDALPVPLDPGMQPFADLRLRERPRFTVQIRLAAEQPPPNATLVFVPAGGDLCASMDYGISANKNGTFEVREVPEGLYVALVMRGRDVISDVMTIKVERTAPNSAQIPLVAPTEIQGTVYFDVVPQDIDIGAIRVNLTRAGQELRQVATGLLDPSTMGFSIPGIGPGSYYLSLDLPPGFYVHNIVASKLDTEKPNDCITDLSSPSYAYLDNHGHLSPTSPLRVPAVIPIAAQCVKVQVKYGYPITGLVRDRTGKVTPGALVVAIPKSVWTESGDRGVTPPDRYLTATTDATGAFRMYGATEWLFVIAGREAMVKQEYHLYAFEDIDPNMIYDPAFTERFRGKEVFVLRTEERTPPGDWMVRRIQNYTTVQADVDPQSSESCPGTFPGGFLRRICILTPITAQETAGNR
jgi:protocatechuate 3,4-dioxygenase beta subunit